MPHSPALTAFLRQVTGDGAAGVVGLLTDIPLFKDAMEEGGAATYQEEGADVVISNVANFVGAGVTVTDIGGVATIEIPGGGGGGGVIHITHELPKGTNAGAATTGVWNTRVLNTVNKNTIVGASLAGNQITLPAGDYYARAWQVIYLLSNRGTTRIFDTTGSAFLVAGASVYGPTASGDGQGFEHHVDGYFTLGVESDVELQLFPRGGSPVSQGIAISIGGQDADQPEVYAMIQIEEL